MTTSRTATPPPDLRNPMRDRRGFPPEAKKKRSAWRFIEPAMRTAAITFLAAALFSHPASALEQISLSATDAGIITLKAENSPLNRLLQELARKCGLDLKAPSLSNEGTYLDLTGSSLEDVLKKLLRGYNYVLIKPDGSGKGSLIVFGKVQRVEISYPPPSAAGPSGDAPVLNRSTGETAASPAGQGFAAPGEGSLQSHGAGQRPGEASAAAFPGGAEGGGSHTTAQTAAAAPSGTGTTSSGLTPPVPPQIAGHDLPPAIPTALLGRSAAAAGTGSGSTSGGSSGSSSGSSGASGGNSPPAPPAPPQIPRF